MSTSKKTPASIRQGGPGASHENAKEPKTAPKPGAFPKDQRSRSKVSGGGGEKDRHHTHDPHTKS